MLSSEQVKNITVVFNRFLDAEINGWDTIDDKVWLLEFLTDKEIYIESKLMFDDHKNKKMCCPWKNHETDKCPVQDILDAVESILNLYQETKNLHINNKYILSYYLALSNLGMIIELKN